VTRESSSAMDRPIPSEGENIGGRAARSARRPHSRTLLGRRRVVAIQVAIVAAFLLGWQFIPQIPGLGDLSPVFDPFFISSPVRVGETLYALFSGQGIAPIWPYLQQTVQSALLGTFGGTVIGATAGILLSNDERLNQILRPFVLAINAIPRIALIPIIVIIFGATVTTTVVTAVIIVTFVVFFNAYEGGRSVPRHVLENAILMEASPRQVMQHIRLPYVLAWTFAALPNAVSFGLVGVVTAEILTGFAGIGRLLVVSVTTASSSLTFSVVVVLSVVGVTLVSLTELLKRRWLHWWLN
jgi:NitT/TauT family transport system permease protein